MTGNNNRYGRGVRVLCFSLLTIGATAGPLAAKAQGGLMTATTMLSHRLWVNCDNGHSLQRTISKHARTGTKIRVKGVCQERVVIRKNRLIIEAVGNATIDGAGVGPADPEFNALITVDGATGVLLDGLSVQNSSAEGVIVQRGASATMRGLTVTNNANVGIIVDHGRVEMENSTSSANLSGLDAFNNSSVIFRGQVNLTQNFFFGLGASNGAALELRGGTLDMSQNGGLGAILGGAHLAIFNFGVSQGSRILLDNNGMFGLVAVGGGRVDLLAPPPFQNTGINVFSATGNGAIGVWLTNNGIIESPFGAATFNIENNPVGLRVEGNSTVTVVGGMNIKNNPGTGLLADGAGVITIVPAEGMPSPLPSEITGNGEDVNLAFGSRATLFGTTIGTVTCDDTALVRGAVCP